MSLAPSVIVCASSSRSSGWNILTYPGLGNGNRGSANAFNGILTYPGLRNGNRGSVNAFSAVPLEHLSSIYPGNQMHSLRQPSYAGQGNRGTGSQSIPFRITLLGVFWGRAAVFGPLSPGSGPTLHSSFATPTQPTNTELTPCLLLFLLMSRLRGVRYPHNPNHQPDHCSESRPNPTQPQPTSAWTAAIPALQLLAFWRIFDVNSI